MDHEKPQAVSHHVLEYGSGEMSRFANYSDLQHAGTPSIIEPDGVEQVEEGMDRLGENVW
jgi:hypothetical protein